MIIDLNTAASPEEVTADVLIVGAGTCGLVVAQRLAKGGKSVVVLEAGGMTQDAETHPFNEVVQLGQTYKGASDGRFRCMGGTSTRWGGAMLPFTPWDLDRPDTGWKDAKWPVTLDAFLGYVPELEALFGLPQDRYDFPEILEPAAGGEGGFLARLAKWPPFKQRNVATLLSDFVASDKVRIWINATATTFDLAADGRLSAVTARNAAGTTLRVKAQEVLLCTGAIESTRILLLLDRQHDDRVFAPDNVLGRYFYDHLSCPTAHLDVHNPGALNRITGFRFQGKAMRNLRFEATEKTRADHRLPAAFAHIGFATDTPTGFDALRDLFRKLQKRQSPGAGDIAALTRAAPWLAKAVWWRFVEHRLLFPDQAQFDVHMVVEQEPTASNRITLSPDRVDPYGQALACIDWRVGEGDVENSLGLTRQFMQAWRASRLAPLADISELPRAQIESAIVDGGGIFHPGGTVRMGVDRTAGVIDSNLRSFAIPNLSVASTAVFPSGGAANPTMMLLLAGLRWAEQVTKAA